MSNGLDFRPQVWTNWDMGKKTTVPDLDSVLGADTPKLRALYREIFQNPPPKWSRIDCLRGNLAWATQALQEGHNPHLLRRSLLTKINKNTGSAAPTSYRPGTRLIREWQGQTYEVTILEKGYLFHGRTYRSLSSIAEAITGSHWSGNRFFGIGRVKSNDQ